jgi:malate dehydrogenase (oxaloacetate-decarboxylating)
MAYTPGVARVCEAIHLDPDKAFTLTIKKNTVAVVSDGTAVLGLGDIGPAAAMPVMEGKAMLFKEFAGVDAFPICLATKDADEIVRTVKAIAPGFGGINLEDISAPRCFEIEERLRRELDIPVFHDDQHGTAVVTLAALENALKVVDKKMGDLTVVIAGVGAAGVAIAKILMEAGVPNVIGADRQGAVHTGRPDLNKSKQWFAENTNPDKLSGSLAELMPGADVFIGLSGPNLITREDVMGMATDPVVFAMANPDPEIRPELIQDVAAVIATGRSDFPNQINNVLAFPGIFRGALDAGARRITENMKVAAAHAIAATVLPDELAPDFIIPSVFNPAVAETVARASADAAVADGVCR